MLEISSNWISLFIVIPMATAILTTMMRGSKPRQRYTGVLSLFVTFVLAVGWTIASMGQGPVVSQMGGWPAPFGISLVLDPFSGMLIAATSLVAIGCLLFATETVEEAEPRGWMHPLVHLLVMGVQFSFLTGDLFNLFVAFEIMLMASYALLVIGGSKRQLTQAYKYVMLNLIGSTVFVIAAGLVYGMMGTLNFADLARIVHESGRPGGEPLPSVFPAVATMLLFVFAMKAAAFPLWFWLPDTYHTCPVAIGALFGGLLTKVGIYAMARVYPMVFAAEHVRELSPVIWILLIAAGGTMLVSTLGALAMTELRRILALLMISSLGYQIFGIALMGSDALAGTTFYMVQSMVVTAASLLCCGLIERHTGTDDIRKLGGLLQRAPVLSVVFFIVMMALAGLPPMSSFFGKALLLREGLASGDDASFAVAIIGLIAGAITLLVLARVWVRVFWLTPDEHTLIPFVGRRRPAYAGVVVLLGALLAMSFGAEPMLRAAGRVGDDLVDPTTYISAVLPNEQWHGVARVPETPDGGVIESRDIDDFMPMIVASPSRDQKEQTP
ncbi:MAG: proton-conducting transporter transmembrane domain-containing protein [Planctomycetota bacterium]|jgi:multicomponent Na+:H+ antiporter subunit D